MNSEATPSAPREDDEPWLAAVLEAVAREVHDEWWRRRLSEGWSHGPQRDDVQRQHPSLIPYEELSEEEREYDRSTIRATIRGLRSAGFRIVPAEGEETAAGAEGGATGHDPAWYAGLAESALKEGKPLVAYEIAAQGLAAAPQHVRLRQLQALALARSGAPERASRILQALAAEGREDEETLGLLARTKKDAALAASDPAVVAARLRESQETYERSYRATGGYYTGINAATLALLCGEPGRARVLAAEVEAIARRELESAPERSPANYYPLATLAEAALLQEDERAAEIWLARALAAGRERLGDLASTRRNLRLILEHRGRDAGILDEWLPIPRIGLVYGDAATWPAEEAGRIELRLRAAVDRWVAAHRIGFVYGGGAPGLDLLASERMQEGGGRSFLVLPYPLTADTRRDGVEARWAERLERVAAAAAECTIATEQHFPGTPVFERFAGNLRLGLALVHARLLDTEVVVLDVRREGADPDGGVPGIPGGHLRVERLSLDAVLGEDAERLSAPSPAPSSDEDAALRRAGGSVRIAAVLFADVLRYSALEDRQIPVFVEHFLGLVGRVADSTRHRPLARNTWGDGLYFVFEGVRDAGLFALELQRQITTMDWAAVGLRADLALRIGLHAGPVFGCSDPVTGAPMFTGRHTVRAARIEPVTPPGMIYGSREFAALATAAGVREFACEPVGRVDLAKGAANLPLFVVRGESPPEPRPPS